MRTSAVCLRATVRISGRSLLGGLAMRTSRHGATVLNSTLVITSSSSLPMCGSLAMQRRTQYAQSPGKREQEAFLTQFDPMEVLAVEADCNVEDIDAAFEKMKGKYGPNGQYPDAKMVERVFRAHEILKDPDSPYYLKAHSSQTDRQRLQFQLLPKAKRRIIEFQVCVLMLIVFGVAVLTIKLILRPMNRSIRAATR